MAKEYHIPTRTCVACRQAKPKRELLRIVKPPQGEITIDSSSRANGRGAYICNSLNCMQIAKKNKSFNRAFKCEVPPEVYDNLIGVLSDESR